LCFCGGTSRYVKAYVITLQVARGHVDYGLVPVENVMIGGVAESLDGFLEFSDTVSVCAEVQLAINHALITSPGARPADITSIYSKPEAIAQCRRWLSTQYPHADIVNMTSTSAAIELIANTYSTDPEKAIHMAAIGSRLGAGLFELPVMFPEIQDVSPNVTRFVVLCSSKTPAATTLASGTDRTSVLFVCQDRPGALKDVLDAFASEGINLSHIEKRPCPPVTLAKLVSRSTGAGDSDKTALPPAPSPVKTAVETGLPPSLFVPSLSGGRGSIASSFVYAFVIEADGHISEDAMSRTIQEATKHCVCLQVLGSFPAARRIL
jgi:prephenate dehydratase